LVAGYIKTVLIFNAVESSLIAKAAINEIDGMGGTQLQYEHRHLAITVR
jgi:hypothetical protein